MGVSSAIACKGAGALWMWMTAGEHVPTDTIPNPSSNFLYLLSMALYAEQPAGLAQCLICTGLQLLQLLPPLLSW